jgi:hypothetical protein
MMINGWHLIDDDCIKARECVCGFCKREGMCDFGDCHRPAAFRMVGQGTSRPACKRCAAPDRLAAKILGYKVAGPYAA